MNKAPKLGQHFLASSSALAAIIEAAKLTPGELVLEIGPGKGALTERLLAAGARVIAVEKDTELIAELARRFAEEVSNGSLKLIHDDVRNVRAANLGLEEKNYVVVANIPYYLTGLLIRKLLEEEHQPERIVLLIQKEVAERIAKSEKESLLSIAVKAYGSPTYIKKVPAGSFTPPPSVDSAIIRIEGISRDFFSKFSEETFFSLLHAAFAHKRKTLGANLREFPHAIHALERAGIDPKRRAEDVHLAEWKKIAEALNA